MSSPLGRIIIYTKKTEEMVAFYCQHFGYEALRLEGDRIVELVSGETGMSILLHPLPVKRKEGQTLVKLVFDVEDVEAFCAEAEKRGLTFGAIHHGDGYSFANAKDPSKNSISVSSRAFAKR
ncbi:Glyoxalase family protein [Sulfitobacter noctilucicola]|uniref:Putative enzyme related to lactoylglutathione lyase n=1 Tax=Sulfitobacter noctilucicola TaxID=1342301 RepID=A0A7W6M703_9RHOB|nr:VOC family protein [Sulfitobacter noctilucicola]KIN62619.1 Glyoxalase family protein [Sulfitobacter noctilucicola]MBB4172847.1 putative enzyme related to lactoylglutathione lyase [Sulfitobacter noctilucicola]